MIAASTQADPAAVVRFPIPSVVYRRLVELPALSVDVGDPAASRAAAALAGAETITRGKGLSYVVTTDPAAAGILWQIAIAIEGTDTRSKQLGAALRDLIVRINREIRDAGWTYPTVGALPQPRRFVVPVEPGEEFRNTALLTGSKTWTGVDDDYAIIGGRGEPTRTAADMRVAVAELMERYLARYPLETGPVHQAAIVIAATMIVREHYPHPCTFYVSRRSLRKYVEIAEQAR